MNQVEKKHVSFGFINALHYLSFIIRYRAFFNGYFCNNPHNSWLFALDAYINQNTRDILLGNITLANLLFVA